MYRNGPDCGSRLQWRPAVPGPSTPSAGGRGAPSPRPTTAAPPSAACRRSGRPPPTARSAPSAPPPGRGRRPERAEKHGKEPDFSRISSASLQPEQCYREAGDFAAYNYCGQLGLAGMSAFRLANCTQQLGGLTPGIILRPTRHLLGAGDPDSLAQARFV